MRFTLLCKWLCKDDLVLGRESERGGEWRGGGGGERRGVGGGGRQTEIQTDEDRLPETDR